MNELIKIENKNGIDTVNAREIYNFLEIKHRFEEWFKKATGFGFVEGIDYTPYTYVHPQNKQTVKDYYVSLRMAVHLSMVSRSKKGVQVRDYFMECEKKLKQVENNFVTKQDLKDFAKEIVSETIKSIMPLIQSTPKQIEQKEEIVYYSITGYARREKVKLSNPEILKLSKIAIVMSGEMGVDLQQIDDSVYGYKNLYHRDVLKICFENHKAKQREIETNLFHNMI